MSIKKHDQEQEKNNLQNDYDYEKPITEKQIQSLQWFNNQDPPINATNLNSIENRISYLAQGTLELQSKLRSINTELGDNKNYPNSGISRDVISNFKDLSEDTDVEPHSGKLISRQSSSTGIYKILDDIITSIERIYEFGYTRSDFKHTGEYNPNTTDPIYPKYIVVEEYDKEVGQNVLKQYTIPEDISTGDNILPALGILPDTIRATKNDYLKEDMHIIADIIGTSYNNEGTSDSAYPFNIYEISNSYLDTDSAWDPNRKISQTTSATTNIKDYLYGRSVAKRIKEFANLVGIDINENPTEGALYTANEDSAKFLNNDNQNTNPPKTLIKYIGNYSNIDTIEENNNHAHVIPKDDGLKDGEIDLKSVSGYLNRRISKIIHCLGVNTDTEDFSNEDQSFIDLIGINVRDRKEELTYDGSYTNNLIGYINTLFLAIETLLGVDATNKGSDFNADSLNKEDGLVNSGGITQYSNNLSIEGKVDLINYLNSIRDYLNKSINVESSNRDFNDKDIRDRIGISVNDVEYTPENTVIKHMQDSDNDIRDRIGIQIDDEEYTATNTLIQHIEASDKEIKDRIGIDDTYTTENTVISQLTKHIDDNDTTIIKRIGLQDSHTETNTLLSDIESKNKSITDFIGGTDKDSLNNDNVDTVIGHFNTLINELKDDSGTTIAELDDEIDEIKNAIGISDGSSTEDSLISRVDKLEKEVGITGDDTSAQSLKDRIEALENVRGWGTF